MFAINRNVGGPLGVELRVLAGAANGGFELSVGDDRWASLNAPVVGLDHAGDAEIADEARMPGSTDEQDTIVCALGAPMNLPHSRRP